MTLRSSVPEMPVVPGEIAWRGVRSLIDHYIGVEPLDDQIYVLYTVDARNPAAWLISELRSRGRRAVPFNMLPVRDDGFKERLRGTLPAPSECGDRLLILTVERDTLSHGKEPRRVLAPYNKKRVAVFRIINASEEFFTHAVNVKPQDLSAINAGMLNRLMPAGDIRVSSSSGTDLTISLESDRYRWISNRGMWRAGNEVILPAGEVSTFPATINGTLVADGAFNISTFTGLDARLTDHPVRVEIEDGRLARFSCAHPLVEKLIRRCVQVENFRLVGELGFGTNVGITEFVPMNSHINERHPGVHVGFGAHGQLPEIVPYRCDLHFDLITSDARIEVGGDGAIDSTLLNDLTGEHPAIDGRIHDQDLDGLDGDCCALPID